MRSRCSVLPSLAGKYLVWRMHQVSPRGIMVRRERKTRLEKRVGKEQTMAERAAAGGLDLETFRRAAEGKDPDSLLGLYADDAEYVRVDRNSTPSSPMALRGKEEISEYLRDVFSRDMTHSIENEVVGRRPCGVQLGVRIPGRHQGSRRRDGRVARRNDRAPGERSGLGRVG